MVVITIESNYQTIMKKINIRRFAQQNKGENQMGYGSINEPDDKMTYQELNNNLKEAYSNQYLSAYRALNSQRKRFGKLIVFFKKVIRKLLRIFLGWYINPLLEQQSFFNGKLVNAVSILCDLQTYNNEMLDFLNKQNRYFAEAIQRNDIQIDGVIETINQNKSTIAYAEEAIKQSKTEVEYIKERLGFPKNISLLNVASQIDYMDFENRFRGSRESVKKQQEAYVDYFKVDNSAGKILDIGCGRGEFLELMWENGVYAYGVDVYQPFVDYCVNRGFLVSNEDALTHLIGLENSSLSGIFMAHIAEHLDSIYLRAIFETAYRKLKPNCHLVLVTPNPESLLALMFFYSDIEHKKPIPFRTLQYFLEKTGFSQVDQYYPSDTIWLDKMKPLLIKDSIFIENVDEFNRGIDLANTMLFGFGDYALIAKK